MYETLSSIPATRHDAQIGIIQLDSTYPKEMGNMANPSSFPFPVAYETISAKPGWWMGGEGLDEARGQFIEAARRLENSGVKAITTACGLFACFQPEVVRHVNIPVFSSPLMIIPFVSTMIGPGRYVGVISAAGERLFDNSFLENAGVGAQIRIAVAAVDKSQEFISVIREQKVPNLDHERLATDLVDETLRMISRFPDIGALVLECSDIPPYAHALANATGLPVFDFVSLTELIHRAVAPRNYS